MNNLQISIYEHESGDIPVAVTKINFEKYFKIEVDQQTGSLQLVNKKCIKLKVQRNAFVKFMKAKGLPSNKIMSFEFAVTPLQSWMAVESDDIAIFNEGDLIFNAKSFS